MKNSFCELAHTLPLDQLPILSSKDWKQALLSEIKKGAHLSLLTLLPGQKLCAVLSAPSGGRLLIAATQVEKTYPSLTPDCPQAQLFEREIFEQHGVEPLGHPWLKPVRAFHENTPKFQMAGEEMHEVAVGPVHAGVIEPGHFRFQCRGETVYHLEISLGYQHRGIESKLLGGPDLRTPFYMETLAGDTSIGHATAYAQTLESLSGATPPPRAQYIRSLAAEFERLANHVGDLGALSGDVGFLPTLSHCGRLRGDILNLTALLCGNRFGRGLVRPGGVCFNLSSEQIQTLEKRLEAIESDVRSSLKLLFDSPSVLARFESTGVVDLDTAQKIGLVGPAARASGWGGDVLARARVRRHEIDESFRLVHQLLQTLSDGEICTPISEKLPTNQLAVGLVEGWRGEIFHLALTGADGRFVHYKIVDPSFHNWLGLAMALRNEEISDFPLCNKSFNLSYCGHDL